LASAIAITMIIILGLPSSSGSEYKKSCDTDADCQQGTCKFDPDYNKKVCTNGTYCSIQPDNLKECSTDNDCITCINEPAYGCVVVDALNPYNIKQGNNIIKLPDSKPGKGWCLPPFKHSVHCNSLTADTILTETLDSKGNVVYQWSCLCKFPDLVTQSPGQDCNIEVACGAHENIGSLYVPDGSTTDCKVDTDCTKEGDEICYEDKCYKNWATDKDVDPTKGICKCPPGLKYVGTEQNKMCLYDGCAPHGQTDDRGCICDKPAGQQGYLACPNEILNTDMKNQCKGSPTCLPDPCWPGGTADPEIGCKCIDGYIREFTPGSAMQWTCKKACEPSVCGPRGTCIVTGTGIDKKEECTGCVCPYTNEGDPTKMCAVNDNRQRKGSLCDKDIECCSNDCSFDWWASEHFCN
jgi:hypothetical protein